MEDLSGIRQELEEIWGQLENLREPPRILGAEPGQSGDGRPEESGLSFEMRLRRARDAGDMLAALKVKQEAAKAGIVLL